MKFTVTKAQLIEFTTFNRATFNRHYRSQIIAALGVEKKEYDSLKIFREPQLLKIQTANIFALEFWQQNQVKFYPKTENG